MTARHSSVVRVATIACVLAFPVTSRAEDRATDEPWDYCADGELAVDGGLTVGFPAALPTGLARGVGLGITHGRTVAWGARASWSTASEASEAWAVTHRDLRVRMTGAVQHAAGRGTVGLRVGAGGVLVSESRLRHQGMRAGLSGAELETSSLALVPTASLEGVVVLHVIGPWSVTVSGGPNLNVRDGRARMGWGAELGVAWQP